MHSRLLLAFLLMPFCALAQVGESTKDSLLNRLYNRAATLMGEGELEAAQACFDSAFAMPGAEESPVYPILLNEQATLHVYQGDERRALEEKKSVLPYLPRVDNLETHISVYNDLGILYRRAHEPDSALHYYNKALDAALRLAAFPEDGRASGLFQCVAGGRQHQAGRRTSGRSGTVHPQSLANGLRRQ